MVGIFHLAPHHDYLQYITSYTFNANGAKTRVLQDYIRIGPNPAHTVLVPQSLPPWFEIL